MITSNAPLAVVLAAAIAVTLASCVSAPPPARGPATAAPTQEKPKPGTVTAKPTTEDVLKNVSASLAAGNMDAAIAAFDALDAAAAADPSIRLIKASVLASAGKVEDARAIAADVVAKEPNNAEALYVLAAAEGAAGREKERIDLLNRAAAADPRHAPTLAALGATALRAKSYKNAEAYFDKCLAADPVNADALLGKARLRRRADDPAAAEAALKIATENYPTWADPWAERGRLNRDAGLLPKALADLDTAVKLAPKDYWIAIDRGSVLLDMDRKTEALKDFDRAAAIDPAHFLSYVYSAGIRDELGDYAGAERDYALLAKLKPDYYFAFEALGILRMRDGRWEASREAFMEAYKRSPSHANYALLTALAWMRARGANDAKPFLAKTLTTVPRESIEWYLLRLYHDQSGDTDVVVRIDKEKNKDTKARMLYYLTQYYAFRGNDQLADRFLREARDMDRKGIVEWRLIEWALEARTAKG